MAEKTIPDYEIDIFWSDEDEAYIAVVPDLPYCSAWGETREEALAQVQDAIRGHVEVRRDTGRPVPEPKARRVEAKVNEAAEQFAEAIRESYQALADRSVSAQELNAQLTQDFFNGVINNLRIQAENNRALGEDLIEQQRKQQEKASQALTQESVNAYMDFLNSMFSYYRGNLRRVGRTARN
jgi:predicted RNase H-like HicB family nuclease